MFPSTFDKSKIVESSCLTQRALFLIILALALARDEAQSLRHTQHIRTDSSAAERAGSTLVSYSYFEKDQIQRINLEFFLVVGLGHTSRFGALKDTDFVLTISGETCTPCQQLISFLPAVELKDNPAVSQAWSASGLTLLQRSHNEGMDFGAHNVTLEWLQRTGSYAKYRYFIFLNSSVRGPFVPSYMPPDWQWTRAYTDRLVGNVKLVSSSITCLPERDPGGPGPRAESWAFATDASALKLLVDEGVFHIRDCKFCEDGVIALGEYGLTTVLFGHGHNIATLMSMYRPDTNWLDKATWHCNNNTHPSRHGTYDRIAMHPFEVVFLKASWNVGEPHTGTYTRWLLAQADSDNTAGIFDEDMYAYAISAQAQQPSDSELCVKAPPRGAKA